MSSFTLQAALWRLQRLGNITRLIWFDLKHELNPPVWIFMEWIVFGLQLAIYGALISRLITGIDDYLQFYAVGFVVMMTFEVGSHTGRHFVEHAHEGRLPYLLSLPIPRYKLFLAIALQGGVECMHACGVAVLRALAVSTLGLGMMLLQRLVEGVKSG